MYQSVSPTIQTSKVLVDKCVSMGSFMGISKTQE